MMDRRYTPYQRRQVISHLMEKENIDIVEAAARFKAIEFENPDGLALLCSKFSEEPEDDTPIRYDDDNDDE